MPYQRKDSRFWWVAYTDASGKGVRRSTGTADRKEAAALEQKWRLEAYRQSTWGEAPQYSFDELMVAYLRETADKPSHDRDRYSAKALTPFFAARLLAEITPQDVSEYRRQRKVSAGTVAKELRLFSAAINYARREWGWQIDNPIKGRVPKEPPHRMRWLTRQEADRLIAACPPYLADFVTLALNTGMRRGELLGLEWDRVDFGHRLIYLQAEHQKSGRFGTVALNNAAVAALRRRLGEHETWVFNWGEERLQSVKKAFATACRKAKVKDFTVHDLRHTCAAWLVQSGVPIRTVADVLRHKDIRTTMRYAHLAPESAQAAVSRLDREENVSKPRRNVKKRA